MKAEHKQWIEECIRQMRLAVSEEGYNSPYLGNVKRTKGVVTYWAGITVDGHITHNSNQACHASLDGGFHELWYDRFKRAYNNPFPEGANNTPKFVITRIMWENNTYRSLPNDCVDAFLKWLTKVGPYATVFVQKGGKVVRERGYLVARCNVPSNLLAGALFASRAITEHFGSIAWVWWKLVQRGVHPSLAFYHAHQISAKDHDNVYIQNWDWHVSLNGNKATKGVVLNFKNKIMPYANENYDVSTSYYPVHDLWGDGYGTVLADELHDYKNTVMIGKDVLTVANPFLKVRVKEECNIDDFCDLWAQGLIEFWGKDNE